MILDLYFFRPPGVERPIKENNPYKNITIESFITNKGNITRERNAGICDFGNSYKSKCTTDMNTTTDDYNNILTYDEIATSQFISNEENSFIKKKITKK